MPQYHAPGVHIETEGRGERYLEIIKTDCAVFFGMAERGPLSKAVRVSSFGQYREIFGNFLPGSYLPYAVYGFFLNGGRECYIIRIAHTHKRSNEEVIGAASCVIKDKNNKPLFKISAASGGTWGNSIVLDLKPSGRKVETYLASMPASSGDGIKVANPRKFSRGDIIRISSGSNSELAEITSVRGQYFYFKKGSLEKSYPRGERSRVEALRFTLKIKCGDSDESFDNLSIGPESRHNIAEFINQNSRLIHLENISDDTFAMPRPVQTGLSGGTDGVATIIPDDYIGLSRKSGERVGLALLDELEEGRILALPDLHTHQDNSRFGGKAGIAAVLRAAIDYVENSHYRFLLIDPPLGLDIKNIQIWREDYDTAFAALSYPWLKAKVYQSDEILPMKAVPPSGYIAGLLARSDIQGGTHHSFANKEIEGIVDTGIPVTQMDCELLNPDGINTILTFPGRGIRVWGARTLSSDADFRYINVRRTLSMIEESVERGTQWVTFEPNSPDLWQSVKRLVYFFLKGLWKKGYLQGENVDQAFYIKVDEENNTLDVRDRGELIIDVGVAIVRPAEFIVVRVAQKTMETQEE